MAVKWTTKINKFPEMEAKLKRIDGKTISVGYKGEMAWLAGIHEYGCTITPVYAKYLTVPLIPEAYGRSAGSFSDLFYHESDSGGKFLARNTSKGEIECVYLLTKKVVIPERAFLRLGFEANYKDAIEQGERLLPEILDGTLPEQMLFDTIGEYLRGKMKDFVTEGSNLKAKSSITIAAEDGADRPLVKTEDLIRSMEYKLE